MFPIGLFLAALFMFTQCGDENLFLNKTDIDAARYGGGGGGGGGGNQPPADEGAGNNLSYPVIWAEGTEKTLRVPPAGYTETDVKMGGEWWYVWGVDPIDPQAPLYSCDPALNLTCYGAIPPADLYKAYLQKDANNYWQAYNEAAVGALYVDSIDWGDNLESVNWSVTSQVRTEIVLYKNMATPVLQYAMRHVSGWGTDEVHGLQTTLANELVYGPGTQATVYSAHGRLTIQRTSGTDLTWDATSHQWVGTANAPCVNSAVYEAADGPGYFNAEVNVKGKIIYGFTWNVRTDGEGAGTYRMTFSLDPTSPATSLNTFFDNASIIQPSEEEEVIIAAEVPSGGTAVLDKVNNLTYIDIVITSSKGGGGKSNKPVR